MADSHRWQGSSGDWYTYSVFTINTNWNDVAGNYIFTKRTADGYSAIYIGETDSFASRLNAFHHKMNCIEQHGATHVHARTNKNESRT